MYIVQFLPPLFVQVKSTVACLDKWMTGFHEYTSAASHSFQNAFSFKFCRWSMFLPGQEQLLEVHNLPTLSIPTLSILTLSIWSVLTKWEVDKVGINEFRSYEVKVGSPWESNQDTSGLSSQCSATEPQQLDNHQPSQSSICTAQVVLNASVAHLAATQYVLSELR